MNDAVWTFEELSRDCDSSSNVHTAEQEIET